MSQDDDELTRVLAAARLEKNEVVDDPLAKTAQFDDPLPIRSLDNKLDSWFVPLVSEGALLGFLQLEPDLRLHRYSSFQRTRGSSNGCPARESWLDPQRVEARAQEATAPGERTETPVLSYEGNRDRIAWRVPIADSTVAVYVAGDYAYRVDEPHQRA